MFRKKKKKVKVKPAPVPVPVAEGHTDHTDGGESVAGSEFGETARSVADEPGVDVPKLALPQSQVEEEDDDDEDEELGEPGAMEGMKLSPRTK